MQSYFNTLSDYLFSHLKNNEVFLCNYSGENSDFARINQCKLRQTGSVTQHYLTISLIRGARHCSHTVTLSTDQGSDEKKLSETLSLLRNRLSEIDDDPFLLYSTKNQSTVEVEENLLPNSTDILEEILTTGQGHDLVGIFATGDIARGFSNSIGQRNWFQKSTFSFNWSLYHQADKAVKCDYSGFSWDTSTFRSKFNRASDELKTLTFPAQTIPPGKYRVYLAPAALEGFIGTLSWRGFGLKTQKTKSSSLIQMLEDKKTLSPKITMLENTKGGISPNFQSEGFIKPDRITLIENGRVGSPLISPRSAKEYGVEPNGAGDSETAESFEMFAGEIPQKEVIKQLDTGIYINNTHYLNYSEVRTCRITGMTRFACFWVENGQIKAPLNVMRFDESIYNILGDNLIGLTKERDFSISSSTYGGRSTETTLLPGALVEEFSFTI